MFDFDTTLGGPLKVTIDKKDYQVPRFLIPDLKEWAADQRATTIAEATAHLEDDAKARFLTFFQPPPIDVFDVDAWSRSPEGIDTVLHKQLEKAGVSEATVDEMIASCDPLMLGKLSNELTSARASTKRIIAESENNPEATNTSVPKAAQGPLTEPAPESGA